MLGPVYYHPLIYRTLMRLIYKKGYEQRYKSIAELIPEGFTVNDICCGDGYIYFRYLKEKKIKYHGFDINPIFVNWLARKGVASSILDLYRDDLPQGDCLLLQASLYQFIPRHEEVLERIFSSNHKLVIISEPIENFSSSRNPLFSIIAQYMSATFEGPCRYRFDREELEALFGKYGAAKVTIVGRELLGLFNLT